MQKWPPTNYCFVFVLISLTNLVHTCKIEKNLGCKTSLVRLIDLIHDGCHVGFAIVMQINYTLLRGQTTQVREVIKNILATQMIRFTFITQVHYTSYFDVF